MSDENTQTPIESENVETSPTSDVGPEPVIQTSDVGNVDDMAVSPKSDFGQEPIIETETESPTPTEPVIVEKKEDTITITEIMEEPKPASAPSFGEAKEVSKAAFDTKFPAPFRQGDLWQKFLEKLGIRKRKKLDKILDVLNKKNKITNDEVEKLLHISDATATRYLDQLEKEGKIRQVGKTGKYTYYEKN